MDTSTITSETKPPCEPSSPLHPEAPLLALIKKSPDEMTLEELEAEIEALRSARVNTHILSQKIQNEAQGKKLNKALKKDAAQESKSLDIGDLL